MTRPDRTIPTAEPANIDQRASNNFEVAKAVSILVVAVGHFGIGYSLWQMAALGLFVFGFSSGFFTSCRYHRSFSLARFWLRKLERLGPDLLIINAFLLVLFVIQRRQGIWTWHTPLSMVGLGGFLNWFDIANQSPFGAGLWFFRLLLIFYLIYPVLRIVGRSRLALWLVAGASLIALGILHRLVPLGYMLWLTAWSFVLGVLIDVAKVQLSAWVSGGAAVVTAGAMLAVNIAFSRHEWNFWFLAAIAAGGILWLKTIRLPSSRWLPIRAISSCLLQMYFVHPYLSIRPTGLVGVDLSISLMLTLGVSLLLAKAADLVVAMLTRVTGGRIASAPAVAARQQDAADLPVCPGPATKFASCTPSAPGSPAESRTLTQVSITGCNADLAGPESIRHLQHQNGRGPPP